MRKLLALAGLALFTSGGCGELADRRDVSTNAERRQTASGDGGPKTVTSEEVRLSDIGQSSLQLTVGKRYRIVGRVRSLQTTEGGLPRIIFTGSHAVLDKNFVLSAVESLEQGEYVAVDCTFTKPDNNIFPLLDRCDNLTKIISVSAAEYKNSYDQNPFRADSIFKDQYVVVHGEVRLADKLTDGRDYVAIHAQKDFSDVTAILSSEAKQMTLDYAKVGQMTTMICYGGYRYNQVGSVGLKDCRFFENY